MITPTFAKGDTVRVVTNMKVLRENADGSYELNGVDEDSVDAYADYIPANHLSLLSRALPPEPPVGSYVWLKGIGVFAGNSVWRRQADGWHLIDETRIDSLACQWKDFVHTRVYIMAKASSPVS